jgi:hypothetical protein
MFGPPSGASPVGNPAAWIPSIAFANDLVSETPPNNFEPANANNGNPPPPFDSARFNYFKISSITLLQFL